MKVLIAEDDKATLKVLEKILDSLGYKVISCQDGIQAWEALQEGGAPSLLLLNWMMPGMDGIELYGRVREREKDFYSYIILLTSKTGNKYLIEGMEAGADDYITKPFDAQELRIRLRAGMRIIELNQELVEAQRTLRKITTHDQLTGVLNRGSILHCLETGDRAILS